MSSPARTQKDTSANSPKSPAKTSTSTSTKPKNRTPTNIAAQLAGDKRRYAKKWTTTWNKKTKAKARTTNTKPKTKVQTTNKVVTAPGAPPPADDAPVTATPNKSSESSKRMRSARYGVKVSSILVKLVKGAMLTPTQMMSREYRTASLLYKWAKSHAKYGKYPLVAEQSYHYVVTGTDADPRGRLDLMFELGKDSFIVEIKTTLKTDAAYTSTYNRHTEISNLGIPNSRYARHQCQLWEMIRSKRSELDRRGCKDHTVSGVVVYITSDHVLTEVPADKIFDRDDFFQDTVFDSHKVLVSAKRYLVSNSNVSSKKVSELQKELGMLYQRLAPMSAIGPQHVVSTKDGTAIAIWVYKDAVKPDMRATITRAINQHSFSSNHIYYV